MIQEDISVSHLPQLHGTGSPTGYYLAQLNDDGTLENSESDKQFIVEMNSEVRFRLRRGAKVSVDAVLLINKPRVSIPNGGGHASSLIDDDEEEEEKVRIDTSAPQLSMNRRMISPNIEYSVTQPRQRITEKLSHIEPSSLIPSKAVNLETELIAKSYMTGEDEIDPKLTYRGSSLEKQYLERVDPHNKDISVNLEFRIHFPEAGSFFIQIEYTDPDFQEKNYTEPIYINVEPILVLRDQTLKVKELSILTVISRCLGTIEDKWEDMYNNISQLGYNAVHFAPIQKYGYSMSHYSIADQTLIDDFYFQGARQTQDVSQLGREDRIKILKHKVDHLKNEYGLLGIMDIVLNHTAGNSSWLLQHPEAAYNTKDCPNLTSAYILDRAIADFSADFANSRNVQECPSAPYINNETDLKAVLNAIQNRVINRLNLQEYFMFNIADILAQVKQAIASELRGKELVVDFFRQKFDRQKLFQSDQYQVLNKKFAQNRGASKNGVKLLLPHAAAYFYIACNKNEEQTLKKIEDMLKRHNGEWRGKVDEFMKRAIKSLEGEMRYFKLEKGDKQVTAAKPLVKRYFRELQNAENSQVAHNGWIENANPLKDFAMVGWHYLDRSINIWGDSVKLRYGNCPADSPFLWEHMSKYVYDMAMIFDGFRLDNAHSTPIHVAYYMLQVARSVNPNLFVMAELFTSSAELDALFVKKLNINGLIREIQNTYDTKQLGDFFHQITCREAVLGLVDPDFEDVTTGERYRILKPRRPNEILYDCTHDNPAPIEKFRTGRIALSHMGVISMSDITIATTWGYDQLLPYNISVINEKRVYSTPDQSDLFKYDGADPRSHMASRYPDDTRKPEDSKARTHHEEKTPKITHMPPPPTEFDYEYVFYSNTAKIVQLAGDLTGWQPSTNLIKQSNDKWSVKLTHPIINGQDRYQFKFVIDGKDWQINSNLQSINDGKGNINNVLEVPNRDKLIQKSQSIPTSTAEPKFQQSSSEWTFNDIRYARKKLNAIHTECTKMNAEIFLHQQNTDVLVIIRQFPLDYSSEFDAYVSITRHCYFQVDGAYDYQTIIELPGLFTDVVFAGYLEMNPSQDFRDIDSDKNVIKSANSKLFTFKSLQKFCRVERSPDTSQEKDRLVFFKMPPSFTCVIRTRSVTPIKDAAQQLNIMYERKSSDLALQLFGETPLSGFNHLLFRCETEEREISGGKRGPYGLEKYGVFTYSGIASFMTLLRKLKVKGDMGHELFNNMRAGDWYLDYAKDRLNFMKTELRSVIEFLNISYSQIKKLPMALRPKYGSRVIEKLYNAAVYEITQTRMKDRFINVNSDDLFVQRLALAALQMHGRIPSAQFQDHKDTMAAGLPHFSTGYMRCWGRDTFISLRGLMITTGLWDEAKDIIVQFAKVIRHGGLIPNLHDRGNNTRFNARDATWFFMQSIKDFFYAQCSATGSTLPGERFLKHTFVDMHFRDQHDQRVHNDKLNRGEPPRRVSLIEIMQEIIQAHASGIQFREWNAGSKIDGEMKDEGFNVNIWLDRETGFLNGGNQYNCGTWMDKMGSSDKTGNKGIPATPRDGAPIELTAMLYSALRFMEELIDQSIMSKTWVSVKGQNGNTENWTYKQWADRIKTNFERCYWVPQSESEDHAYVIDKRLVNRRSIYKDVFRSSQPYTDYQLRPNLCVAMSYAPDLFQNDHARACVQNVEKILMEPGCMGIKTLDPRDKNYKGDYVNSDDSRGWNYHQGPEWLWPVGFFLKAKMIFSRHNNREEMKDDVMRWLVPHQKHIVRESRWEGLPELTNSNGKPCADSCTTQAWSIATILDAVKDLHFL